VKREKGRTLMQSRVKDIDLMRDRKKLEKKYPHLQ
jgi:hypothetical protein